MAGRGWVIEFAEDVRGPFAPGALAHFGLGLIVRDLEQVADL